MSIFNKLAKNSKKASEIIRKRISDNGGTAVIQMQKGGYFHVALADNGNAFECDKLPRQLVDFRVFDIIVDFLKQNGGKAPKGMGRTDKVGIGKCGPDTVMYQIATKYYGRKDGESTFDPLFVLATMLDWAGIAENGWGYLQLL